MKVCLEVGSLNIRSVQISGSPWTCRAGALVGILTADTCSQRSWYLVLLAVYSNYLIPYLFVLVRNRRGSRRSPTLQLNLLLLKKRVEEMGKSFPGVHCSLLMLWLGEAKWDIWMEIFLHAPAAMPFFSSCAALSAASTDPCTYVFTITLQIIKSHPIVIKQLFPYKCM
jgi:hypothetical protein